MLWAPILLAATIASIIPIVLILDHCWIDEEHRLVKNTVKKLVQVGYSDQKIFQIINLFWEIK